VVTCKMVIKVCVCVCGAGTDLIAWMMRSLDVEDTGDYLTHHSTQTVQCVRRTNETHKYLFGSKMGFGRILDLPYGLFGGVYVFGYNSAESEPIWMKSAWNTLSTLLGADPGRFWVRFDSSDSFEWQTKIFLGHVNNARFYLTDFPSTKFHEI